MSIRVLIADDHSVVRQGLQMFLALDGALEVVGEAKNGVEAVDLARQLEPDVVLMDLLMPEMDGIEATRIIRQELPDVEVIALTSVLEDKAILDAVRVGAIGYLLKDTESEKLREAILAAAAGQVRLSPEVAVRLMREVSAPDSPEVLTDRETEVLRAVARGWSNQEIADRLVISEATVKTHVSSILSKLNLPSRTRAALCFEDRPGFAGRSGFATLKSYRDFLTEERRGVLRFGGARMALLDIEAGFWGLRRQIEALAGERLTDSVLQQAGANGGASFAAAFTSESSAADPPQLLRECVAAYQAAGFGRFEIELLEWPLGRVLIRGEDTFEAWMMGQQDQEPRSPACAYAAGVLVGFVNVLAGRNDVVCIERTCQAQGAEACLFELLD